MTNLEETKVGDRLYVVGASYQIPYTTTVERLTPKGYIVCEDGHTYRVDGARRGNDSFSSWYAQPLTPEIAERIESAKAQNSIYDRILVISREYNRPKGHDRPSYAADDISKLSSKLEEIENLLKEMNDKSQSFRLLDAGKA